MVLCQAKTLKSCMDMTGERPDGTNDKTVPTSSSPSVAELLGCNMLAQRKDRPGYHSVAASDKEEVEAVEELAVDDALDCLRATWSW